MERLFPSPCFLIINPSILSDQIRIFPRPLIYAGGVDTRPKGIICAILTTQGLLRCGRPAGWIIRAAHHSDVATDDVGITTPASAGARTAATTATATEMGSESTDGV